MAQVLEYLARQQAQPPAPALPPLIAPAMELTPPLPVVTHDFSEPDQLTFKTGSKSETTLDAGLSPLPSSILAVMERASRFLQPFSVLDQSFRTLSTS
ncbi:UNVERIFIED_CONTAM: hypothetical protein FKN15_052801 [Acipenser sinensis]